MRIFKLLKICLSLFDGGEGGAAAQPQTDNGTQGGSQAVPGHTRRGDQKKPFADGRRGSGEFQNVVFGKQQETTGAPVAGENTQAAEGGQSEVKTTSDALEEKRRAYRALMEGEYKDQYTEDTQRIIDRRFRETKGLQEQLGKQQPVIDALMQRYKITDGDLGKLMTALDNDDAYFRQAAEEAEMSVESFKQMQRMQRENEALKKAQAQARSQDAANQQIQRWMGEAEQMKALYPSFDLGRESQNPAFIRLLQAGTPVQHAYEVIHMDEIKAGIARSQAKATEKQIVDGIKAKGARPTENGVSSQSAFIVKDDVSKLTKAERAEIARRSARGEHISF